METRDFFVVLGSQDNEMRVIQDLLQRCPFFGGSVVQAVGNDGRPVSPRDAAAGNWSVTAAPKPGQLVVLCELRPNALSERWERELGCHVIRLDHHGPDDPPVPTLAQVATILLCDLRGLVTAIADHNLGTAYRLYPEETWQVRRSSFGWTDEQIEEANLFVSSMTPHEIGEGLTVWVGGQSPNPAVADILIRDGRAGLLEVPSDKEGTTKLVLSGATSAAHVEWLRSAATRLGWESYGFPDRGLGGVYVPAGHSSRELFEE